MSGVEVKSRLTNNCACVCADDRTEGGMAGVQFGSGCRRSLYLHCSGPGAEPLFKGRQEQTVTPTAGEGTTIYTYTHAHTYEFKTSIWSLHLSCDNSAYWFKLFAVKVGHHLKEPVTWPCSNQQSTRLQWIESGIEVIRHYWNRSKKWIRYLNCDRHAAGTF